MVYVLTVKASKKQRNTCETKKTYYITYKAYKASVYHSEPKEGGTHSHAGEGMGEAQFGRQVKKHSSLSTLWLECTMYIVVALSIKLTPDYILWNVFRKRSF